MVEYKDVVLERLEDAVEDAKKEGGTVEVAAAGNTFYADTCMGDLVALGYMTKRYVDTVMVDAHEIEWTLNEDAGFTVDNGYDVIEPGETVVWEK